MQENNEKLVYYSNNLNLNLNSDQIQKICTYIDFLIEYNSHTNLTAITDPEEIIIKHFLDSILLNNFFKIKPHLKMVDIGTGAGFPSVPLKIVCSDLELLLVDGSNKKVKFLQELISKLKLSKTEALHERAENLGNQRKYRHTFDYAVSRAVAPLSILCEYSLPLLKMGGKFIAFKGPGANEELEQAKCAIETLGGQFSNIEKFTLPEEKGMRTLIFIDKIAETPLGYPRHGSKIKNKPIQ